MRERCVHDYIYIMHLSMTIPTPTHLRVGWGNSGDLTKYCVENPTTGALPNVNTPQRRLDMTHLRYSHMTLVCNYTATHSKECHLRV